MNRRYQQSLIIDMIAEMRPTIRKQLDHTTHFAGRFGAIYFITICCQQRGSNQLCHDEIAAVLANTARIYHERARWNLNLLVLMPDHLHALIGVDGRTSLAQLIRDYKRITTKMAGVKWQRNFFDHRLRHDESFAEKFAYICQNPVRTGLVRTEEDWRYVFVPDQQCRR
ncbi:MAG TPA: transposase [Chthoniobacterales bacterium]|nr:transposase [Chthoniobacterales bacterium]